jgi:LVIVD repeat/Protein of unknown function (DUF1573)
MRSFLVRAVPLATLALVGLGGCGDSPVPVPGLSCGPGTKQSGFQCVPAEEPGLEPGGFSSPLVQLQRLQGEEDHMHIAQVKYRESDARLFYCSYTFGVIDASDPQDMSYLAEGLRHMTPSGSPRVPGCLHLAWDDDDPDLVFTTHRGNIDFAVFLSGWDLQSAPDDPDSLDPVQLPALQEPGESYGGLDVENGLIYVALHGNGLGIYDYDATTGFTRVGTATGLENAWSVAVRGNTAFVADGLGGLATVDVTDPQNPAFVSRAVFGGNAEDLVIDGDTAYVAAGSAGLVLVDIADPASPAALGSADTPGSAVGVDYADGRAYVAAWNDVRIYDVADRTAPAFIGAVRLEIEIDYETCSGDPEVCVPDDTRPDATARTLAVAAHDEYVFVGNWWVPYSYQLHPDRLAPYAVLPEDYSLVDFGPTDAAATSTVDFEIENHGTAPLTVFDSWTDNPAFTVTPRQALIEPGESAVLTLEYTATTAEVETALLQLRTDDPQQPTREAHLVGNQTGLGPGQPLPDTVATLLDGSTWSSKEKQGGQVLLLAYFATF